MSGEPRHHITEDMFIEYVADTLDMAARRKIEAHLMTCEACRQIAADWRQIAIATRADSPSKPLPPLNWRLIKGDDPMIIARPTPTTPRQPAARPFNFAFPMAFATLAVAAIALFSLMGGPSGDGDRFGMVGQNQQNEEATATPPVPLMTPTPATAIVFPTATPTPLELPPTIVAPIGIPLMTPTLALLDPYNLRGQPENMPIVVIAARDIENGSVIMPDDLTLYAIDERFVPANMRLTPDQLVYRIARFNLACGQMLTANMVADNARDIPADQPEAAASENCATVKQSYVQSDDIPRYNTVLYYQPDADDVSLAYYVRELPAGHTVTADDFALRAVPASELIPHNAVTAADQLIGRTLKYAVAEGQTAVIDE